MMGCNHSQQEPKIPTLRKRWEVFDVALGPDTPPPKRPLSAITQKLVSRPVEFFLPLCHATNGETPNDARMSLGARDGG